MHRRLAPVTLLVIAMLALSASLAAAAHVSRISISGTATNAGTVEIDFTNVGQVPPGACAHAHANGNGEAAGTVRDGLVAAAGETCDADNTGGVNTVTLIRDPADAGGIVATANGVFQCWVKNGATWELVNGQTINGLTFSKEITDVPAMSRFGMAALVVLLLGAGTVLLRKRLFVA